MFTRTGTLLTSAQQGDTLLWDPRTGRILRRFALGGLPALAPDGDTVALGQNSPVSSGDQSAAIVLLNLRTGSHRTLVLGELDYWIRSLAFTRAGSEIAGAATDGLHVWDLASGKIVESYVAGAGPKTVSALDGDSDILISGQQDGSLAAFDLAGGRRLGRAFSWNTPAQACASSPCMAVNRQSSLIASAQADGTIALVDLRTLRLVRTLPARDGPIVAAVSFMPDGRTLVTGGGNRRVTFWAVHSGRVTRTLRFAEPVWWTAASLDGKLLAVQTGPLDGSDNRIELVRIATGKVLQNHALPYGPNGVEFSRDGQELVALGCCWTGSGSALVAWDVPSGRQLFRLGAGVDANAFDIAPHSGLLGVGTGGGQFLLLDPRTRSASSGRDRRGVPGFVLAGRTQFRAVLSRSHGQRVGPLVSHSPRQHVGPVPGGNSGRRVRGQRTAPYQHRVERDRVADGSRQLEALRLPGGRPQPDPRRVARLPARPPVHARLSRTKLGRSLC